MKKKNKITKMKIWNIIYKQPPTVSFIQKIQPFNLRRYNFLSHAEATVSEYFQLAQS